MQLMFPSGLTYGVIKMDPLAMVEDLGLDDPDTLAAVAKMTPKKYLVYLEHPLDVPLPKSRWCRYSMSPIATTLRAKSNGLLPDMVVPIFPNTQYSSEKRPAVVPQGNFPASNCFHWIENVTNIRVRPRRDGEPFDDARAVSLNGRQHVAMQMAFSDDYERIDESLSGDSEDSASSASGSIPSQTSSIRSIPPDALRDPKVRQACSPLDISWCLSLSSTSSDSLESLESPRNDDSSRSATPDSSGSGSDTDLDDNMAQSILGDLPRLNLFGWEPDPTVPFVPLVDLWMELEDHICADDIPSPLDWYREEEEIASIITEAFERRSRSKIDVALESCEDQQPSLPTSVSESDRPTTVVTLKTGQTASHPRSKSPGLLALIESGARWARRAVTAS